MYKLFLIFLCLSVHFSYAKSIVTANQDLWPPFVEEGIPQGISVDIVKESLATQGYELEFKLTPWSRALSQVKNGSVDILVATWVTQERKKYLIYSDSYISNKIKFIKRAGDSFEYYGMKSLTNKTVGVVRDYGYGDVFLNATHFEKPTSNDIETNLKKLKINRIDLTLEDEFVAKSMIRRKNLTLSDYEFTKNSLSENSLHVTTGSINPRGREIIDAFNKGLIIIKGNGVFERILADYGLN